MSFMQGETNLNETRERIRLEARARGFDAVGVAPAALPEEARAGLAAFLAQGRHGDMGWMAETAPRRGDPKVLWPEARSIVMLAANYGPAGDPRRAQEFHGRGAVSVYARSRDYHDVMKRRAKALARWMAESLACQVKVFVDTAPVMEKPLAQRAGLGWQGKHTNLVSRDFGSWLFLAEVFTTLDLPSDRPETDLCGNCNRCVEACPTGALDEPYKLDARRCISYLTIEHKGDIPDHLAAAFGNRIFGCDDCLAACPWNKFARPAGTAVFSPRAELAAPRLADLAELDDAGFREVFAGTPLKRTGRDRFLRNVLIAIGNGGGDGDAELVEAARRRLDDASPLVRRAADWALRRLAVRDMD